jgi:hypothetical protein
MSVPKELQPRSVAGRDLIVSKSSLLHKKLREKRFSVVW